MAEPEKLENNYRRIFIDIIHVLGSVASITGISLLLLKDMISPEFVFINLPIYLVLSIVGIGAGSLAIYSLRETYRKYELNKKSYLLRVPYWCFSAIAFILVEIAAIGLTVIIVKVVMNISM